MTGFYERSLEHHVRTLTKAELLPWKLFTDWDVQAEKHIRKKEDNQIILYFHIYLVNFYFKYSTTCYSMVVPWFRCKQLRVYYSVIVPFRHRPLLDFFYKWRDI